MRRTHTLEWQKWSTVASLFVIGFLVAGVVLNTIGLFVTPLAVQFGWSRLWASSPATALAITAGCSVPVVGWLLDHLEARVIISIGVTITVAGYLVASAASSFAMLVCGHALLGIGVTAAGTLPLQMVVANWFEERRGLALGITMIGTSSGGLTMVIVGGWVIQQYGWRTGYLALAAPMAIIAIPVTLLTIRTRPRARHNGLTFRRAAEHLPGLELSTALTTRSFWLILVLSLCLGGAVGVIVAHTVSYLISIGYSNLGAAAIYGMLYPGVIVGKVSLGVLADRITVRPTLAASLLVLGTAVWLLHFPGVGQTFTIAIILLLGFPAGVAPLVLLPMLQAESLGLKRFGSIGGIVGLALTAGQAAGPLAAGYLFDLTGTYALAFELCGALAIISSLMVLGCVPLKLAMVGQTPALASV